MTDDPRASRALPGFWRTALNVALRPRETFARPARARSAWRPLPFALAVIILSQVFAVLSAYLVVTLLHLPAEELRQSIAVSVTTILLAAPILYVDAGILHLVLRLLGSRGRRYAETFGCACLATAPVLLAIVPILGSLVGVAWSYVVLVLAVSEVHGRGWLKSLLAVAGYASTILIPIALRIFVLEAFRIPSASMWPSLLPDDHFYVMKLGYEPGYGDPIAFRHGSNPAQDHVKRVIGMPGDRVTFDGSQPIVNGWRVPRCAVGAIGFDASDPRDHRRRGEGFVEFLGEHRYLVFEDAEFPSTASESPEIEYPVHDHELFVVGDNRNNSFDSRTFNEGRGGGVRIDDVIGPVWLTWMSLAPDGCVLWERIGHSTASVPLLPPGSTPQNKARLARCLASVPAQTRPPTGTMLFMGAVLDPAREAHSR
ncbi:MAG: signal peptidase I [Polyangiaceae bacterium]|nr:signal peptidase I [Polyangiaceae bacterium]